jgi:biopolymer transport protein ExbD
MAKPLMYRPPPRWQLWTAFGGALVIMSISVVIAGIHPEQPPAPDISQAPEAVTAMLEAVPPPEQAPPEELEIPPPPPPPEAQPEFREEQPTPPPQPRPKASRPPVAPIRRVGSMSSVKAQALFGPKPEYPYEARRQKQTGSGVCVLTVDVASGNVTDVDMAQSTGSPILDNSATSAFKRWRFRPNSVPPQVRVPITYTLTGASY